MITLSAVWRCAGPSFDVERFLRECRAVQPDAVFREGQPGFNTVLVEEAEGSDFERKLQARLVGFASQLRRARELGGTSVVDIAVLRSEGDASSGFSLSDGVLAVLASARLGLVVSIYPVSDA